MNQADIAAKRIYEKHVPGERYGLLVTLERSSTYKGSWWCKCDCGAYHLAQLNNLRIGDIVSCGCYKIFESSKNRAARRKEAWAKVPEKDRKEAAARMRQGVKPQQP